MNRLTVEEKTKIIGALVEGNSIRATCRMTGHSKGAVLKLLAEVGEACIDFHDKHVRNVASKRIQCDEIWSFCYAKEKNHRANIPVAKSGHQSKIPQKSAFWSISQISCQS